MKNARRLTALACMLSDTFREPSPVRGTVAVSSLDVRAVLRRRHAAGVLCGEGSHIY
jgi:hypothetical protein